MNSRKLSAHYLYVFFSALLVVVFGYVSMPSVFAETKTGAVGIEATIAAPPPAVGATISLPTNGQVFRTTPITVTGICPKDLLVKIYKNNIFGGSTFCTAQGGFSVEIDLFSGTNDLVARVSDALDQSGPDSNTVSVRFDDTSVTSQADKVTLTSKYSTRSANPNEELRWPLIISGGNAPYAIAIDWGDGATSPLSVPFAGEATATHKYTNPGVYKVIFRLTDSKAVPAFLQVVSVVNGEVPAAGPSSNTQITTGRIFIKYIIWPLLGIIPILFLVFWLAARHENRRLRHLMAIGRQPFE